MSAEFGFLSWHPPVNPASYCGIGVYEYRSLEVEYLVRWSSGEYNGCSSKRNCYVEDKAIIFLYSRVKIYLIFVSLPG